MDATRENAEFPQVTPVATISGPLKECGSSVAPKSGLLAAPVSGPHVDPGSGPKPYEEELDEVERDELPPTPRASTPASPPPAEPRSKAGEGNPSKPKPADPLGAAIDRVATLKTGSPRWTREKIADVVAEALSQGRAEQLIVKAIVDIARGVHGDTDSPRRLLAGGPWWDSFIPAPAVDRATMCRQHRGEPAESCGRCAAERKGAEPEGGLLPGRTRKEFTRRSGKSADLGGRRPCHDDAPPPRC
jgi:hypothetical protein